MFCCWSSSAAQLSHKDQDRSFVARSRASQWYRVRNSEAIEWQYERVLIKGFSQIATFTARDVEVRVDAVELKDTATATRAIGLVIALRETDENPRENRSFVDYDEIDRLLQGLTAIGRVNESVTKLAGFEARYRTVGDLEFLVFRQSRSGIAASVTSGICERVTAPLTLDDLDRLKQTSWKQKHDWTRSNDQLPIAWLVA